ncbi:hypothetical protein MXD61_02025 [Frankia sp. AgPm24]|uniref:hypothetical protein n=1 Tax=Frankia sp. AgPm24 TaxID=631128 RepID=UPI00200C599A|nr:hypothetical protein [Frankia sp. AgPm24]MCK9920696.1 hypothetical protein [Frankia sp. AgPm24]
MTSTVAPPGAGDDHAGRDEDDASMVVVLDLRDDPRRVLSTPIGTLQREHASQAGRRDVDTSRILVVADVARLEEYRDFLVRVSAATTQLLVLGLGRRPHPERLYLPAVAELPVLWAGDLRGVRWTPGRPGRVLGPDKDAQPNLAALLQALSIPSVFSRARGVVLRCTYQVAAPAIHLLLGRVSRDVLDQAAGQAFEHFTQDDNGIPPGPGGAGPPGGAGAGPGDGTRSVVPQEAARLDRLLTGSATTDVAGIGSIINPNGQLPAAAVAARRHLDEAAALITALRDEPFAPRRSVAAEGLVPVGSLVWTELTQAGAHLGTLAVELHRALTDQGGSDGVGPQQRHTLALLGVQMVPVPAAAAAQVRTALARQTDAALGARETLAATARRLRDLAVRARPTGSAQYAQRVPQICPPELITTLRTPPPFPRWLHPGMLSTAFLSTLLAGLWFPVGVLGALVTAALTVGIAVRLYQRRPIPQPREPADPRDLPLSALIWYGLDALGGAVVGIGAGVVLPRLSLGIGVVLLLAGLALAFAPLVWWRRAVNAWQRRLRLNEAANAISGLGALLVSVGLNEWVLADERLGAARLASAVADAVDAAQATLRELRPTPVGPRGPARPGGFGPAPGGAAANSGVLGPAGDGSTLGVGSAVGRQLLAHQGELADIVTGDVAAAIRTVLNTHGEEIARMRREDLGRDVHDALHTLLTAYDRHLERRGPLAPPPFDTDQRRRVELARRVWQQSPELGQLGRATSSHPQLLQLTNEEDLRLLDPTPDTAAYIRFIPRIANPGREEATGSPDIAGLIRLTELTSGSVRRASPPSTPQQRPTSPPTPPVPAGTPDVVQGPTGPAENDDTSPSLAAPPTPPAPPTPDGPPPQRPVSDPPPPAPARPADSVADEVWSGETTVGSPGTPPAAQPVEARPAEALPAEPSPAQARPAPLTAAKPDVPAPVPPTVRSAPRPDVPEAASAVVPDPAAARVERTSTEADDLW